MYIIPVQRNYLSVAMQLHVSVHLQDQHQGAKKKN